MKPPSLKEVVQTRGSSACHYCGFNAQKLQRTAWHHPEGEDAKATIGVVTCPLCNAVLDCGHKDGRPAMIPIYLPELPQEKLNTLVHGLWGHETIYGGVGKAASIEIYNELFDLNKRMKEIWGGELQIEDLKLLLTEMKKTVYIKRTEILGPMRLLPLGEEFYDCKKYYQEKVYPQVTKSKIESIASKIFS